MVLGTNKEINGWKMRQYSPPVGGLHPVIVMLHGWTGDEDAMWIFASRFPKDSLLVAPRGLFPASQGGYSWTDGRHKSWPSVDDFQQAIVALRGLLSEDHFPGADLSQLSIVGFSQGAALAYAFTLAYPEWIQSLAGLSGFLPAGFHQSVSDHLLIGNKVFIAHGTKDHLVPVKMARETVATLQNAGAVVTYCEDNVGHKLSLSCFKGLEAFFRQ